MTAITRAGARTVVRNHRPTTYPRLLVLAATLGTGAIADEPPPDAAGPPPREQFLIIPLRVHLLTSDELPEVDCRLSESDVRRIVGKVNGIWSVAGVHFGLESIVREPAARVARFKLARGLEDGAGADPGRTPLGLYRLLIPEGEGRRFGGLHVYYLRALPVNGVYMGTDFAIVQETARLRPVEGGIDEPIPRVTAHELGHALGLAHRQDRTNLLASGTTGTTLNVAEVETARRRAETIPGALSVPRARDEAESAGETDRARLLRRWLSEIPGDGDADDRASPERLGEVSTPPR